MITSYPASSQRLPVPGVIPCVFKHRAALSPQTLIHFPFCSSSACGRQIFGMGTENHMQRGAAAAGESTLQCLHSGGPWADTPPWGDQSWEKKPAHLPALHPGCQRAREDGEDLLTQHCCLLTGYHRFPSPLHLPLPAPVLLLFKATDRDRALQEMRLRLAKQRKISSLN